MLFADGVKYRPASASEEVAVASDDHVGSAGYRSLEQTIVIGIA